MSLNIASASTSITQDPSSAIAHSFLIALASYGFCVVSGVFGSPVYILVAFIVIDSYRNRKLLHNSSSNRNIEDSDQNTHDIATWIEQLDCFETSEEQELNDFFHDDLTTTASTLAESEILRHSFPQIGTPVEIPAIVKEKIRTLSNELILPLEKEMLDAENAGRVVGLKAQDVVDLVEAIKYLVIIEGGGVSISEDQMKMVRSSVFAVTALAFTTHADTAKASSFCMTKLPLLLCHIQLINQRACEQTDFSDSTAADDTFTDLAIAIYIIMHSLTRALELITSTSSSPNAPSTIDMDDFFSPHIHHFWVRERICTVLAFILGNKMQFAETELNQLMQQVVEQEKRDSTQPLTIESSTATENSVAIENTAAATSLEQCPSEPPKTYLLYTSSIDTFLAVSTETPLIRTAVAQMSSAGLFPGDLFILLCSWHDESNTTSNGRPRSNFIPNNNIPNDSNNERYQRPPVKNVARKRSSIQMLSDPIQQSFLAQSQVRTSQYRSWFDKVLYVRLEAIEDVHGESVGGGGVSKMTISVIQERETVGFDFIAGMDGDVSRMVLENRVKDSLRFGAVRVENEVVKAFF
ncbi:UNVERIFIED_CONTAM: hypothetical protein HDU68_008850 [Siphonaria sp. JEL0065]|nr:hypothetical protein HDU68_008850 [Siphonaria sp. JEL0065]